MDKDERQRRKSGYLVLDINEIDSLVRFARSKTLKSAEEHAKDCVKYDLERFYEKTTYYIYEIKFVKEVK